MTLTGFIRKKLLLFENPEEYLSRILQDWRFLTIRVENFTITTVRPPDVLSHVDKNRTIFRDNFVRELEMKTRYEND